MTKAAADYIEYNTMGEFQTSEFNKHGYYIGIGTGNAYTLQEIYKCHIFDPPFIIPKGELVCPAEFMIPMIKNSYWYHNPKESIPFIAKLKEIVMPLIDLIQDNNTTDKLPLRYKGYTDMNPCLLSLHDHQVILENF